MKCPRYCLPVSSFSTGFVLFVCATVAFFILPTFIANTISEDVAIVSKDSKLYSGWMNPQSDGIDMYRRFTFFNITNPLEVGNLGVIPNFVMRGPFVYREVRQKDPASVRWFDNGSVAYTYTSTYFYEPSMSVDEHTGEKLSEGEVMTVLNAPLFGLVHRMSKLPTDIGKLPKTVACLLLRILLGDNILGPTGLMVQRNVSEILWGYRDPIWELVHDDLAYFNYTAAEWFRSEWNGSYVVPSPYTYRSGQMCPLWDNISECNTSANGVSMELSGADWRSKSTDDVDNGMMNTWAGQWDLWWWGPVRDGYDGGESLLPPDATHAATDEELLRNTTVAPTLPPNQTTASPTTPQLTCQKPHGYDGSRFPPNGAVTDKGRLRIFLDMIWRALDFVHVGWSTVRGIKTARFELDPAMLDASENDNRVCYGQTRQGVLNLSRPLFGPALGTKAMYLDSDLTAEDLNFTLSSTWDGKRTPVLDYLDERYGGRDSTEFRRRFDSFLDVHPLTGLTLDVVAQGTASTYFGPLEIDGCKMFEVSRHLPVVQYYPLVSVLRETKVSESKASQLRHYLFLIDLVKGFNIAAFVVGAVMMVVPLVWYVRHRVRKNLESSDTESVQGESAPILEKEVTANGLQYTS